MDNYVYSGTISDIKCNCEAKAHLHYRRIDIEYLSMYSAYCPCCHHTTAYWPTYESVIKAWKAGLTVSDE